MKNIKLYQIIYYSLLIICFINLFMIFILGNKARTSCLSDFIFNIDKILDLNFMDIKNTNKLFIINNKLNNDILINYIFANESIAYYSYSFQIKYYSKFFKHSDLYRVYLNTNKI